MDEIGKIILNSLLSRRAVWLPAVGTFRTEYSPARDNGDGTVTPPATRVLFTDRQEEGAVPVTDLIGQEPGGDPPAVRYDRWLARATERGPVVIEGIGVVSNGVFTPYESLTNALNPITPAGNPTAMKPVARKAHSSGKGLGRTEKVWLVLIAIFILILAGGWTWYSKYHTAPTDRRAHNPAVTDNLDQIPEQTGAVEDDAPVTEEVVVIEPDAPSAPSQARGAAVSGTAPAGFYVVGGVFSVPENADKYIRQMSAKFPDLDYRKHYPYQGDKTVVTLFGSPDRAEANRQRRRIEDLILEFDLWLYEVK
ncbi:MAG: SPOR domain-containing protein [Rikenellaceae bacterium]|nr:SPOR domain-containing protein [Rikenellaceae bacterium]